MRVDVRLVSVLLIGGVVAGCGKPPEATFVLNKPTKELHTKAQQAVQKALNENFGSPEHLIAWQKFPIDYGAPEGQETNAAEEGAAHVSTSTTHGKDPGMGQALIAMRLDVDKHEAGWKLKEGRNLYMRHCLHCHGTSGDGDGPTAPYLNPRPRDYREGIFKFTSTLPSIKVSRADLKRTLKDGIPGTSMPSFLLLQEENLDSIVEYVRWLSIRGEFEKRLTAELAGDYSNAAIKQRTEAGEKRGDILRALDLLLEGEKGAKPEFATTIEDVANGLAGDWSAPEEESNVVVPKLKRTDPTEDKESIARGRKLYMSDKTKCFTCHGVGAKGDGYSTVDYWDIPNTTPTRKFADRGLHDVWGNSQKPRNLTQGIYRGGRRPIDIYRRVYSGIKGTQMPAFGGTVLNDKDAWDVVNYVLAIPYQKETPTDERQAAN